MVTEVNVLVTCCVYYLAPIIAAELQENENKNLIPTVEGEHSHNSEVELSMIKHFFHLMYIGHQRCCTCSCTCSIQ